MNIDLFLTEHGESGLLCGGHPGGDVIGVILDAQTNTLTLEFADEGHTLHLNIPVEEGYKDRLLFSPTLQVGVLEDGQISSFSEVPVLYLNDPYGSDFGDFAPRRRMASSFQRFEQFMKRCTFAQAVHREDVGDESTAGSVLQGVNPRALTISPHLARQMSLDIAPSAAPRIVHGLTNAPTPTGMHGPKGPGGMGAGAGHPVRRIIRQLPPDKTHKDTDKDTE